MKTCTKCKKNKSLESFSKGRGECKDCIAEKNKQYNEANKEKIKQYKEANKEKIAEYYKQYNEANKEKRKQYYEANKEKIKQYREANKEKKAEYHKQYKSKRIKEDPIYKFKYNVRGLIRRAFKRGTNQFKKNAKTEQILGCTIEEFICYIEAQFKKGMSFDNHGEWHLDHIIPLAIAETKEEILKLNHYTNFQPLWAEENLSKSYKIVEKQLVLC